MEVSQTTEETEERIVEGERMLKEERMVEEGMVEEGMVEEGMVEEGMVEERMVEERMVEERMVEERMADLTDDLLEEILCRIPASSLKQLRRTCRRWNTIFNENSFTKKHFHKAPKEFLFLMLKESRFFSINLNLHEINNNHVLDPSSSRQVDISRVFHCNGLLLCNTKNNRFLVWNPCTGQTKWIAPSNGHKRSSWFALGYEINNCCHSYKILRCFDNTDGHWDNNDSDDRVVEFEIYEFNSDSWRIVEHLTANWNINPDGVSSQGKTYWLAFNEYKNEFLLGFDFTKEKFECLNLPNECIPYGFKALSIVGEEKLAVLHHSLDTSKVEIWTTNVANQTNLLSWSKFFAMDSTCPFDHWFSHCRSLFIDEEKKLVVCCFFSPSRTVYIFGEKDKHIEISFSADTPWCPFIFIYVPSLVQI